MSTSSSSTDDQSYSLRLRLLSAVDLPPSLSPNVPLCPWFELGLVNTSSSDADNDGAGNEDGEVDGIEQREKRELHPKWEAEEEDKKPQQKQQMDKSSHGKESEACRLLKRLNGRDVRTSAFKIMAKSTNGGGGNGADWNEEYRWDSVDNPMESTLAIKLCTRLAPDSGFTNNSIPSGGSITGNSSVGGGSHEEEEGGIKGLWRKGRLQMEEHRRRSTVGPGSREEKAAAVAQFLMKPDTNTSDGSSSFGQQDLVDYQSKWKERREGVHVEVGNLEENREGLCLGTLLLPLSRLPLEDAFGDGNAAVVERWYQLEGPNLITSPSPDEDEEDSPSMLHGPRRCPSVLLELTFASADYLDGVEEEILGDKEQTAVFDLSCLSHDEEKEQQLEKVEIAPATEEKQKDRPKPEEPELPAGIVDFVCIVGARDIGNQRNDDGSKGWVQSTPECCVLERFPPDDDFHVKNGRNVRLIPQAEWFCFPEGCKLWRGADAPSHEDLKAGGVSTANSEVTSPFDSCLGSVSSFSWFVLSSNSDDYGSAIVKTYGVVVRFYVPAPKGIDPTQDDFAQTMTGGGAQGGSQKEKTAGGQKRLWVPIGICLSTTLPIVGVVEEILLRTCNAMASRISGGDSSNLLSSNNGQSSSSKLYDMLQRDLFHLIVNFSKPIPGVVHTSIPFLEGDRLHVTTAPPNGLPSLPHGGAIAATCRLLGAEGLTLLLAAALTECKVLIHSTNVANVAMVAEVISALIFPFTWQLPFIPVLPSAMLEFLEAPLSFFVGMPTTNVQYCDKNILSEIVVVDLDDIASSTDYEGRRGPRTKIPSALPASVSTSISKAVFRLLREEDEIDAQMNAATFPGCRRSPKLENESMAERKFRIHVAIQICSLIRGYQECLFFVSASQPVFNRDRFLRQAPALFEDKRPSVLIQSNYSDSTSKILSPRSKRFLSVLVNSQHFHQLLERLSSKETAFFHEVMEAIEPEDDAAAVTKNYFSTNFGTPDLDELANKLYDSLEAIEQKIPTYRVDRKPRPPGIIRWQDEEGEEFKINYDCDLRINDAFWFEDEDKTPSIAFTFHILKPIMDEGQNSASTSGNVHALSLEYLVELEKNPWRYSNMLQIPACATDENDTKEGEQKVEFIEIRKKIKLRDAIGERRFRAWKIANDHKDDDEILNTPLIEKSSIDKTFDLSAILANLPEPPLEGASSTQPHVDANDRDKVRRCLEIAFGSSQNSASFNENGRDLIMEAESALRNPSAQRYLFSVLSQRNKIEKQRSKEDPKQRAASQQSVSRLEQGAFNCVVRLCIAVLEACMEEEDFESAYKLLSLTGGFCTITVGNQADYTPTYMTEMIKAHSIFADLRLWERVLLLHKEQQNDRKEDEPSNAASDGEEERHTDAAEAENTAAYDAAVSTLYEMVGYGVAAEELARFSTRISEERGWFACDKGQSLLVLARRLTAKRDEDGEKTGEAGDFDLTKGNLTHTFERKNSHPLDVATIYEEEKAFVSEVIAWSHPSVSLHSSDRFTGARAFLGNILGAAGETAAAASVPHQHEEMKETNINNVFNAGGYAGRVAVTAVATFGSTAVVTGGVDGSVFLAHTVHFGAENSEHESNCSSRPSCASPLHSKSSLINGVKLQWGSSGDNDVDCVTGSVSCLTVSKGSGYRVGNAANSVDASGCADEDEIISSMEGCRIIGGTTCGGLRMWSLKDIYQARIMSQIGVGADHSSLGSRSHQGSGVNSITSTLVRHNDDYGLQEAVKGISIGGHRGGVTCIDIPPRMYRPDALLSGGEDGLIKLWSLKSSSSGADGVHNSPSSSIQSRFFANRQIATVPTDYDTSDAQGVLAGHEGRIICIKTAWHGDKLLSGGADKTIRLWDLSGSTKPLTTLKGHQGWVTETHFWGQIIVSASTDRSIALWDTRAGSFPLFNLRYHLSPISDLLIGNRSESLMVSAGADGSLATWDFRVISGSAQESSDGPPSRTVRTALATMHHLNESKRPANCGSVKLARAVGRHEFCFSSVRDDGIVNEWEASTGRKLSRHETGHRDAISGFATFSSKDGLRQGKGGKGEFVGGSVTCSWDGTVRLRRLRKSAR